VIVGAVLAVLALGLAGFLLLRGGSSGLPLIDDRPDDRVPAFSFEIAKARAVPTGGEIEGDRARGIAEETADAVGRTLTDLYVAAFLDPANWRVGIYDDAFDAFAASVRVRARQDGNLLTLGPGGSDLRSVLPVLGELRVSVLLDREGRPAGAAAAVAFAAEVTGADGAIVEVRSGGTYFLQPAGGAWRVIGYRVDREDRAAPLPGPTSSPTGDAS
jgi:hypothetical protein